MKLTYVNIEVEVIDLNSSDVIVTSIVGDDDKFAF